MSSTMNRNKCIVPLDSSLESQAALLSSIIVELYYDLYTTTESSLFVLRLVSSSVSVAPVVELCLKAHTLVLLLFCAVKKNG